MAESNIEKIYRLTPMQEGMLFHNLLNVDSREYVIQSVYLYKGLLDAEFMRQSLSLLSLKHEVLRTAFTTTIQGKPWQVILRDREIELNINQIEEDSQIESLKNADLSRGFSLQDDSLLRISIIHKNNDESIILSTMHHIISDGWCISLLIGDFLGNYEKLLSGKDFETLRHEVEIEKNMIGSYQEYIRALEKRDKEVGLQYWKLLLEGYSEPAVILPIKIGEMGDGVEELKIEINKEISEKLQKYALKEKITLNNIAEVVWGVVLQKYNGTDDVVFGKVVSGRDLPIEGIERMVGLFVNTVPIRVRNGKNTTIRELLRDTHNQGLKSSEYDYCPLAEVQSKSELGRHLLSTLFVFENYYVDERVFEKGFNSSFRMLENREQTNYGLSLTASYSDVFRFSLTYDSRMYGSAEAKFILKRLERIIIEISENPDKKVVDIDIVDDSEKKQLLYEFNDTYKEYSRDKMIHQLFEEQTIKTSNSVALVFNEESITYSELNEKSNQLARVLCENGVKPDDIIGIMVEKSIEMIVGILGVLKSGGAYLPIDPEYPKDRIKFILEDSQPIILLTQSWLSEKIDHFIVKRLYLDKEELYVGNSKNLERINSSSDLAYVIYTSGSTGKPKGVMIEHQGMHNHIQSKIKELNITENSTVAQNAPLIFDISVWQCLAPLIIGGTVAIYGRDESKDAKKLLDNIERDGVTILEVVPSLLHNIVEIQKKSGRSLKGVEQLMSTGEELTTRLANRFIYQNPKIALINAYGPTEASDDITHYRIVAEEKGERIPIGKPIQNMQIYILNENNKTQPIGIPGELCVSGDGLARGYLNQSELTAEKFVENPNMPKERMYRTGDLARWLPDGNIEYLGRLDHQVKIRGFRIELGEIENTILTISNVKEAVVLADENHNLCAFIVCDGELETRELRNHIKTKLPEYMIPSHFVKIDVIPLTSNGKIDKNKLRTTKIDNTNSEKILPRTLQENVITEIWKDVLDLDEVYIDNDFFELGGNSINIIQIAEEIQERLEVEISIADLFVYTKVIDLAEFMVNSIEKSDYKNVFKINKSTSEEKIFIFHGGDGGIFYYKHLAKILEPRYSVYGVQASGINGRTTLPSSVYEMIIDYIKEIKSIQPEGPYILAGYCAGGFLSYDITKIFEIQGEKIKAFLPLDHEPFIQKIMHQKVTAFETVLKTVEQWRRVAGKDKIYTIERMRELYEKKYEISKERQMEIIKDRSSIDKFFIRELPQKSNYCFFGRKVKTPTLVVKAEENNNELFETESWENMTENLEFYEIPGNHDNVLLPPYVEKLGEIVLDFLDRV